MLACPLAQVIRFIPDQYLQGSYAKGMGISMVRSRKINA
jgi:hypothetical protein